MQTTTVAGLKEALANESADSSVAFIDVRTPQEYQGGHIEGVTNVPLDEFDQHLPTLAGKSKVYVHCRSGGRSMAAITVLQDAGIPATLINVEGGIMAWENAGYPIA